MFSGQKGIVVRIRDSGTGFDYEGVVKKFRNREKYFRYKGVGFQNFMSSKEFSVAFEGNGSIVNIMYKHERQST